MSRLVNLSFAYVYSIYDSLLVFIFAGSLSMMLAKEHSPNEASLGVTNGTFFVLLSILCLTKHSTCTVLDVFVTCC